MKDYSVGGQYENIAVTFDVAELYYDQAGTNTYSVDPKTGEKKEIVAKEDQNAGDNDLIKLKKNDDLKFRMIFNWDRNDEFYRGQAKTFGAGEIASSGLTIVHETQHLRINQEALLNGGEALGHVKQHTLMKATNGNWYQERLQYLKQNTTNLNRAYGPSKTPEVIKNWVNTFND